MKKIFYNKLSTLNSQLSTPEGFTLIELIIAFSIMAIISLVGIAAFISYNRTQVLNTAASDVVGIFNLAKARSSSQVKPSCAKSLDGYQVGLCKISPTDCLPPESDQKKDIAVYPVCGGVLQTAIISKKLPENMGFSGDSQHPFLFRVLTGGVEGAVQTGSLVKICGYTGQDSKTVTVYQNGRIVSGSAAPCVPGAAPTPTPSPTPTPTAPPPPPPPSSLDQTCTNIEGQLQWSRTSALANTTYGWLNPPCTSSPSNLEYYYVSFTGSSPGSIYKVVAQCGGIQADWPTMSYTLPANIFLNMTGMIPFAAITGQTSQTWNIVITDNSTGQQKHINQYVDGSISSCY